VLYVLDRLTKGIKGRERCWNAEDWEGKRQNALSQKVGKLGLFCSNKELYKKADKP
jgi:hypothetical protein